MKPADQPLKAKTKPASDPTHGVDLAKYPMPTRENLAELARQFLASQEEQVAAIERTADAWSHRAQAVVDLMTGTEYKAFEAELDKFAARKEKAVDRLSGGCTCDKCQARRAANDLLANGPPEVAMLLKLFAGK